MNVKGTAWISMVKYFQECHSINDREKLKESLDQETRELFESKKIISLSWVDYQTYINVMLTADKVLGHGDFDLLKRANYFTARNDIRGVYRILVSLFSPKSVVWALGKLLNQYYDKGRLVLENVKSNTATIIIEGVDDIPKYHDIEQGSFVEEVLRMAGARNIKIIHPQCMARGDSRCRFDVMWE